MISAWLNWNMVSPFLFFDLRFNENTVIAQIVEDFQGALLRHGCIDIWGGISPYSLMLVGSFVNVNNESKQSSTMDGPAPSKSPIYTLLSR